MILSSNSKDGFSQLMLQFLLSSLWLFEEALSAEIRKFHLNYIYFYKETSAHYRF